MPFLIMILTAVGGAIFWWIRNNPRDALYVAQDAVTTVRNAPRKLAFRRVSNAHPVEGIDDSQIAIVGIAQSFLELDDLPTKDQRDRLHVIIRTSLRCNEDEAQELEVLGRWLINQCGTPDAAVTRLGRRLYKIGGDASWPKLQEIMEEVVGNDLTDKQLSSVDDLKRAMHR